MKLSVGADERLHIVDIVLKALEEGGHQVRPYFPKDGETLLWPQVALQVAQEVAAGKTDEGILMCWTGTGVSIAANKVPGIRAALCDDAETAQGARLWNNANVLCLSMRRTSEVIAKEILNSWFSTVYKSNPSDDACLALIEELDQKLLIEKPQP
jgi:ribose 5-phosphate isomerase B